MPESARASILKPLTHPIVPPRHTGRPVVHLTIDNKTTACGIPVSSIVSYRDFSNRPCSCCIREKMST